MTLESRTVADTTEWRLTVGTWQSLWYPDTEKSQLEKLKAELDADPELAGLLKEARR